MHKENQLENLRPLGTRRHRWEDNIKIDVTEIVCVCADWIHLAQNRVQWPSIVKVVMNLPVP
jgi:hypothetical protein